KYRLYLAAYDNSKAAGTGHALQIHWALLLGPKHEDPASLRKTHVLYHATNHTQTTRWEFERRAVECVRSPSMLGRVFLGKVDPADLVTLERVLADPQRVKVGDPCWNCRKWVEEALVDLVRVGIVQLHSKGEIDVRHLLAYGQHFSTEIVARSLDTGWGIPITTTYP
ncbi:hypothetical protein BD414DRAFT_371780, partial [Trametes punicea]